MNILIKFQQIKVLNKILNYKIKEKKYFLCAFLS